MINLLEKHPIVSWIIAILIAVIIFYISSLTSEAIGPQVSSWKAIAYHFFAFFSLAFFLLPALVKGKRKSFVFVAVIIAIFYAVLDEFHQLFVIGRYCSFEDFIIDSAGVLTASLIYLISPRQRKFFKLL